eukprot:2534466-Amphidinium_carterae.1
MQYADQTGQLEQQRSTTLVCTQKKAYRQKQWKNDYYSIELMGTLEVPCTMMLVMQAILSKHGSQAKQGAAPRTPPARAVLKTLTEMG